MTTGDKMFGVPKDPKALIKRFVELEKQKDECKVWLAELHEINQKLADVIGVGGYFQDDEGTVYKIVVPTGEFVHFKTIGYERTRRPGEKHGSLSLKEAQEAGFRVG